MLKIAMIGHKRIPSREGGVEIVVEELSVRFAEQGHCVDVYNRSSKHAKDKSRLKSYKGVNIITILTIHKKSLDALIYSFFATLRALFGHYDVIHFHAEGPSVMLLLPHILGIRTVVTIHGLDWKRAKWGSAAVKYLKLGEKIIAKYADEVIVLSKNVQTYFKDTYGRETNYIPNGVNMPKILEANMIQKKYSLNTNDYVLFLARIVPEKGLHYLLEAYLRIKTDKKLVIAGGESHSKDYMEQIKVMAARDKRVIMTGFVEGTELEELFSNCIAYILPSDIEGMPISLLEAMSYGRKCLVSDIEENVEVIGERGYYFQKSNIDSLAKELMNILEHSQEMEEENSLEQYNMSRFKWDTVAKSVLDTYCL